MTSHLSNHSDNVTNAKNISNSYAEMDFGGLSPNNLILNCLVKQKNQAGLIIRFQKIDEVCKSNHIAGFMEKMQKAYFS